MADFIQIIVDSYNEAIETNKDPLLDSWILMASIKPTLIILTLYILFVLYIGPAIMKNRESFSLKSILVIYNAYQVLFSIYLVSAPARTSGGWHIMFNYCNLERIEEFQRLAVLDAKHWFFLSKVVDLLDTVFFVLRKKQVQVSFLHVYHHFVMVLLVWFHIKLLPGEQTLFLGFLNSIIHIIMYTYYLIAALGPAYQKYIWWKKYMTLMQLIQFVTMGLFLIHGYIKGCKVPTFLTIVLLIVIAMFFVLFMDFYTKQYNKPSGKPSDKPAVKGKKTKKNLKEK